MFVCDKCKQITKAGERMEVVPIEVRPVSYLIRTDKAYEGYETVKEAKLCPRCAEKITDETDPAFTQRTKYIEFPQKMEDLMRSLPANTIMARWPRNWGRERKKERKLRKFEPQD